MNKVFGVDHVGIGVRSMATMKLFYQNVLGFSRIFGEMPEADHPPMHALIRKSPAVHSGILFNQDTGGISVALFHMTNPVPRPIRDDFRYGDIGVAKITIDVADLDRLCQEQRTRLNFCSTPKLAVLPGWGNYRFVYCRDPEGNFIEFASGPDTPVESRFGVARSIGISVTDLERSVSFYQKHLGFDRVAIESHEAFSGLVDEVSGGRKSHVRSCMLASSRGNGMVELFETMNPRGRSIPFGANWGDFGYLQICLRADDMRAVADYCSMNHIRLLADPYMIDDPANPGSFLYTSDPDGIPVEIVVFP
jgi:catechol 2,3-dioxygenase-like lactoylglutathione lyase family enzyme